ncbi:hypothetical protein NJ7G_1711 [Natrinema sp. J7-2]|nr:hypothetical protein NJ7G_1711 [Natrinema sp. J7-2]
MSEAVTNGSLTALRLASHRHSVRVDTVAEVGYAFNGVRYA